MVNELDSRLSSPGSNSGQDIVLFLDKALNSLSAASLHPGIQMGTK